MKYTWLIGPRTSSTLPIGVCENSSVSLIHLRSSHWNVSYFVLEVDGRVEVRDLGVDRFANHLSFAGVHDTTHLCFVLAIWHSRDEYIHVLFTQDLCGWTKRRLEASTTYPEENFVSSYSRQLRARILRTTTATKVPPTISTCGKAATAPSAKRHFSMKLLSAVELE